MCHESATQMKDLLEGVKPSLNTVVTGLKMLATNQDKNFNSLEKKMELRDRKTDEKLEQILDLLKEYKLEADRKFDQQDKNLKEAIQNRLQNCSDHKAELASKFKRIDESTELLNFFQKRPKLFLILALGIAVLIGFVLGKEFDIFSIFKIS